MSKFNHVMLDLETLSTRTDAAIIQIAAIAFDIETGELGPRINVHVNETSLIGARVGHIDIGTVGWWLRQTHAPAMGAKLTSEDDAVFLSEALGQFAEWYDNLTDNCDDGAGKPPTEDVCLWGHGATFDVPILQTAFEVRCPEVYEGKVPWHYRAPRDTRTLFALAPGGMPRPPKDETREHDAEYDCEYQISQVCGAYAALREQRALAEAYARLEQEALAAPDGSVSVEGRTFVDEQGGKHSRQEAAIAGLAEYYGGTAQNPALPASPYPFANQEALNVYAEYQQGPALVRGSAAETHDDPPVPGGYAGPTQEEVEQTLANGGGGYGAF